MPLDFSKIGPSGAAATATVPREIFNLLKKAKRYQYLRDVQGAVLEKWYAQRTQRDNVIKMNTGSGKTIVGLLALKSSLNEGVTPVAYFCPDRYLTTQVSKEAQAIGLEIARDPEDPAFQRGRAILVSSVQTLINGRSRFGVAAEGMKIPVGSILIDDAHACLAATESQFTLTIKDQEVFRAFLDLFADDLRRQSPAKLLSIEAQDPQENALVPFWAWQAHQKEASRILHAKRDSDELKFPWPLIRDHLHLCRCVIGGGEVEISPRCLPIENIPSFMNARRRIFMTATLTDDSVLVSDFSSSPDDIRRHVTPQTASDIGDRMILLPQELNPTITDEQLRTFLVELSKELNVVVIVPSRYRAEFWNQHADKTVDAETLQEAVEALTRGHVGLVVLINKYDGVDLPDDACRVLVLDGLPRARRRIEKIEHAVLTDSPELIARQAQRIEQGMGRSIRSSDDYSVVFLMGYSLTSMLYAQGAISHFSPATREQIRVSEEVAKQIKGKDFKELREAIDYCLTQDPAWLEPSKGALVKIQYPSQAELNPTMVAQRQAFDAAAVGRYDDACSVIQDAVNKTTDPLLRGWLKQQLAEFVNFEDRSEAQTILRSALADNRRVLRPIEGIKYSRLQTKDLHQATAIREFLDQQKLAGNELLIRVKGLLDELVFREDSAPSFENALKEIAPFIGFVGQRPEMEYGRGPDVLWGVGNLQYFVIECKSGATTELISKDYGNQLNGAMNWFAEEYDRSCTATPILVHPSSKFEYEAAPQANTRIINAEKLQTLREGISNFVKALASASGRTSVEDIARQLRYYELQANLFQNHYTTAFTRLPARQGKLKI
jgi:hypothetical protein